MMPFAVLYPDLARKESCVYEAPSGDRLPPGAYLFMELYCNEPRCDCRRVILQVYAAEPQRVVASINYSFEPATAPFEDEPQMFLDPLNPQSVLSGTLLDLYQAILEAQPNYRDRLIRHYEMWKRVVDDASHPDHPKVRSAAHDDPHFIPAFRPREQVRRATPKVGPNEPCPCGSGKKYKRCCRAA